MRRLVVFTVFAFALAVPAAAFALHATPGDGSLIVQNGVAPKGQAVVQLVISGSAIGRVKGFGKILIDSATATASPEVTGSDGCKNLAADDPRQIYGSMIVCTGVEFRFRAVSGTYAITIYGTGINLVAIGQGKAILAGIPGEPQDDGYYSLNGNDFKSLPGIPSKPLLISLPIG